MYCSNCGHELAPDARFCSNCGAPVDSGASAGSSTSSESERERERREDFERAWGSSQPTTPASESPTEYQQEDAAEAEQTADTQTFQGGFANRKSTWEVERERLREEPDDEWSMSDLGPAKPQRRRTWLWVLLGTLALIVIACCVFSWWLTTDSGMNWFEGIATQAADEIQRATETAATPQP